jgi:hypothetical protein
VGRTLPSGFGQTSPAFCRCWWCVGLVRIVRGERPESPSPQRHLPRPKQCTNAWSYMSIINIVMPKKTPCCWQKHGLVQLYSKLNDLSCDSSPIFVHRWRTRPSGTLPPSLPPSTPIAGIPSALSLLSDLHVALTQAFRHGFMFYAVNSLCGARKRESCSCSFVLLISPPPPILSPSLYVQKGIVHNANAEKSSTRDKQHKWVL